MVGSVLGSGAGYYVGGWFEARRIARRLGKDRDPGERRASLDELIDKFRRHGPAYLILNRFMPGIRTLFFVAAGMARMRPLAVLAYSTLSAALWNLGLIALGSFLGANFETLLSWVRQYMIVMWILFGALALGLGLRWFFRRRARKRQA